MRRAAVRAASLTRFRRSAPTIPGVDEASASRSTSGPSGTPRVCTSRICRRPVWSGGFTVTRRSNRPGRSSAESSTSGRLVEAITITPSVPVKPSISVRIWFRVCSRSSWPPPKAFELPRERPIASSSSMKTIAGAAALACANRSRTRLAPDADDRLDELRRRDREERHVGLAGDRARQQRLARAGQPRQQHALGHRRAQPGVALGVAQEVDHLDQLLLGLVDAGHVLERDPLRGRVRLVPLRPRPAERAQPATGAHALARGGRCSTNSPTIRSVGPNPSTSCSQNGVAVSIGCALMTTPCFSSRVRRPSPPTAGRSVWNRVDGCPPVPGGLTALLKVPWIVLPVDVTSETLPTVTCLRK